MDCAHFNEPGRVCMLATHYSTRPRGHCYQLPRKTTALEESNFFYRLLYRDILSFTFAD